MAYRKCQQNIGMRINPSIWSILLSFMVFTAMFIPEGIMAQTQEGVVISFAMQEPHVTFHEPIFVEFSIHNGLMEGIRFDLGHNRKSKFEFTVTEPDGSIVRVPRLSEEGLGRIGRLSLGQKETYTQRLLLNEWYQFTKLGDYKVEAKLSDSIQTQSGVQVKPEVSGTMTLLVLPRNADRLNQVCQILAQVAVESPAVIEATEAALALSYVQDPISVPYLERVLNEGKLVKHYAITGLGRIANAEAIEILILTLKNQDPELESLTRFILSEVKERIHDPKCKERIETALRT